jgi:hypothetical protein
LWLLWNHQLKICPQIFHKSPWGVTPAKNMRASGHGFQWRLLLPWKRSAQTFFLPG